ncbi:MAG: hypothetical protein RLZZ519_863, partial [Bacteroidota bacterium]
TLSAAVFELLKNVFQHFFLYLLNFNAVWLLVHYSWGNFFSCNIGLFPFLENGNSNAEMLLRNIFT